jgi:hypothetical protein
MAEQTVTYSTSEDSWTSFWSYIPDWMIGMNNNFYSWRNGSLYKHNTNNIRNQFYLEDVPNQDGSGSTPPNYPSTMTTIFNDNPFSPKVFKTVSMYSTDTWDVDVETDLNTGYIDKDWFKPKEGHWFAYIRRNDNEIDLKATSTQGIGALTSYAALTLTFNFNIGSNLSQGDNVYRISNTGTLVLIGTVASHTPLSITLVSAAVTPAPGDMIVYVKNSTAESYGPRGYYMQTTLTNKNPDYVGLFHINTNSFLSFPT